MGAGVPILFEVPEADKGEAESDLIFFAQARGAKTPTVKEDSVEKLWSEDLFLSCALVSIALAREVFQVTND